ncbi:hypothetical protein BDZ90DRAFT_123908 [Jaminaea rosea]|uniref:Enoyl reductase (ER) domain-containing protein n=1 Tax=Jaminaea rosea TaxID=1569628 RepID=A0A316UGP9_9BASI|nr:hypothetical protein BDZ90DRAFT_123908 [Jaminaea rosea]PWN24426.1 hypothetical protein BDZ90DRAFT_123908 [Jaminaea rosea]
MPRNFLSTILNRPSQSYAAEEAPPPRSSKKSSSGGWNAAPTDLPNAPAGPSSLRQGGPPSMSGYTQASTTTPTKSKSTSRFGKKAHKSRPSMDGSVNGFNDGASSIADTNASFSSKRKRWWDTSSLRGFGKGSRSRAGSVAGGESVFSESAAPPPGLAGIGSASVDPSQHHRTLRGTRSEIGSPRSPKMRMAPPLPAHDAAALRAMNATARQEASVAPLGQQPPALNQHAASMNRRHSKQDMRGANLTPSSAPRRALSVSGYSATGGGGGGGGAAPLSSAGSATSSDWNDFMKSMSNRGVSKAWTRNPGTDTSVQRRRSALDRVQKELQEDAQFEQVVRDPGVVRGDLLSRAASAVVGEGEQTSHQYAQQAMGASNTVPAGLRPGSYIGAPQPQTQPQSQPDEQSQYQQSTPVNFVASPRRSQEQARFNAQTQPPAPPAVPAEQLQPQPVTPAADSSYEEEHSEDVESEASSSSEDEGHRQLDAVAEEEEDNSSLGHQAHNEMRYGPRASYLPKTPPVKHSPLPPSPPNAPVPLLTQQPVFSATVPPSAVVEPAAEDQEEEWEEEPQSPKVPPKDTEPSRPSLDTALAKPPFIKEDSTLSASTASSAGEAAGGSAYASAEDEADVSSGSDSDEEEVRDGSSDEDESGKDGELQERPASRAVTFDGLNEASGQLKRRASSGSQSTKGKGKARQSDDDGDAATETGSTRRRSAAPSLQRRLSDLSLGNSFAFSHFMGSKISGRSSSRRIKLGDSDSDSERGSAGSGDDEELKKLALAEQDRLRRMSVGDDFFGGSLSDVLAQFDKMEFGEGATSSEKTAALAEKAQQGGVSREDTQQAQAEAQQIVNEVRRRRAGGAGKDDDGKTVRSEAAGTLAASFAALLLMADNDGDAVVEQSVASPPTTSAAATPKPSAPAELPSSPSTVNANLFSTAAPAAASSPPEKRFSVMDRPRQRAARPVEMGGIAISRGKLAADVPKAAPVDERSTLPSLATFRKNPTPAPAPSSASVASTASPSTSPKAAKRSIDLGDQQRSRDKPPPAKSALKPKTLRSSKSLADTLFSFGGSSPQKKAEKAEKANKKKEGKRARAISVGSEKSAKVKEDAKDRAEPAAPPAATPVAPPPQDPPSTSSSNASPVKEAGEPVYPLAAALHEQVVPTYPRQSLDKGKGREVLDYGEKPPRPPVRQSSHARTTSAATDGTASTQTTDTTESTASQDHQTVPASLAPLPAVSEAATSPAASTDVGSEASAVSTTLTSPSQPFPAVAPKDDEIAAAPAPAISLPPPPAFDETSRVNAEESTPQAVQHPEPTFSATVPTEPAFGMNIIPPTPPAATLDNPHSAQQLRRSHSSATTASSSMRTPTAEVPHPILGEGLDLTRPELARSASGVSKRSSDTAQRKASRRRSVQSQSEDGSTTASALGLPAGMTVTTLASSGSGGSMKRKKSGKKAGSGVSAAIKRTSDVPLPLAGVPMMHPPQQQQQQQQQAPAQARVGPASPTRPPPPPPAKDTIPSPISAVPSRVYANRSPVHTFGGGANSEVNSSSLASLSPPPSTAGSSAGTPDERDPSPARSLTSRGSSTNFSSVHGGSGGYAGVGASGASNYAASEDGSSSYGGTPSHYQTQPNAHRARVRTQSTGPSRRGSQMAGMAAIDEWASSSPISRATSPYYDGDHALTGGTTAGTPYDIAAATSTNPPSATSGNELGGSSPAFMRNAPMGAPTEMLLHPPVPRSRLSLVTDEDRLRATASLDGHGDSGGLSRANSLRSVSYSQSEAGHGSGGLSPSVRRSPMSLTSGMSSFSATPSMSSLPSVPKSGYRAQDPIKAAGSSSIDDRLYQRSTMATISVLSGAFKKEGGVSRSMSKRRSMDITHGSTTDLASSRTSLDRDGVPGHLLDELNQTTMGLTAHTAPPRKIGSSHVLVQVIAVAIDEMDRLLLREKVRSSDGAYGFVPGRSFTGRVMEVGWEVKRLRKGDVVFGLQSARKCGALAEFMTVQQDLVVKAPEDCLTVEQISALPSAGVLAHQVMRNHCANLPKGARILILNAHDGVGLLAMQECADLGPVIVAQCPASVSDGVPLCEANGAHEVVVGEPLWAMNTLHESSFDLVLDTVGGRRLYDAARRILATNGQFVTCFGDESLGGGLSGNPNFKASMRSLRRTFFKKDKKNIGYEWIGVDSSDDCREALEAVRAVAEAGDICPRLRSILAFADASRAFDPVLKGGEDDQPGAVVVRVS